jgi:hypothetical protein
MPAAVRQLTETAAHYQVDGAREWASAATFLAFRPTAMKVPDGVDKIGYFQALLAQQTLLRGAFLAWAASRRSYAEEIIRDTA